MLDPTALVMAEAEMGRAYAGWRRLAASRDPRVRLFASGQEEIQARLEELSPRVKQLWTMEERASLQITAAALEANLNAIRAGIDARLLIPKAVAQANPLEIALEPGEVRHCRCPGVLLLLDGRAMLVDGPPSLDGSVNAYASTDPGLLSQAMELYGRLFSLAEVVQTPRVTVRQAEILLRMARGASDAQITRVLAISQRTLEREVAAACSHFGANGRVDLMARLAGVTPRPTLPDA